jgi:inner membrane protein
VEPVTQGLLGAAVGQALCGRALGRRALVWGALVGMSPDLDVVANGLSPVAEWIWHRGETHALWFGPVVGPLLAWPLWRWKGGRFRDWALLCVAALLTHPLLDVFTTYGTQLLAPFSRERFAFDSVAIIDPLYSVVLLAGIVYGLRRGVESVASRRAACGALAVSTAYLGLGLLANQHVESHARSQLASEGVADARVAAYPTMFQLPFRRVVARSGDEVRVGWMSAIAPGRIEWERFTQASGPLVDASRAVEEVRVLEWFAMGEATPRVRRGAEGDVVEWDDLRYGFPGKPDEGLWGVRVRLSAQGRPAAAERFDRPLPASPGDLFASIWRGMMGRS